MRLSAAHLSGCEVRRRRANLRRAIDMQQTARWFFCPGEEVRLARDFALPGGSSDSPGEVSARLE
jgi:hypothetical protein